MTGPDGVEVRRGGRDLREVGLVVGSGGVLRHAAPDVSRRVLEAVVGDVGGGWRVPERATARGRLSYVLAPAGLLALAGRTDMAARLLRSNLS